MSETELFFAIISASTAIFGSLWAILVFFHPIYKEHKNKRILDEEFGLGPYDRATIERSTKYYIRPKCSNIDPAQEQEPRHALMAIREDLFEKIDFFLHEDESHRHLLILADSGMGKTSFTLNYYAYNQQLPKRKRKKIAVVPLGSKDPDSLIIGIGQKTETVIILDAFDEDTRAIKDHRERIRVLMELCEKYSKVIVTCRTQFFPRDEEIPVETGILRVTPLAAGEKKSYEFWKLYLSPFDDNDVKKYIEKHYPVWNYKERQKAKQLVSKIPLLSIRPMLLAHIPDLIKNDVVIENSAELYEAMIEAWLERESHWVSKEKLRQFSERLAADIFRHREDRGSEQVTAKELSELRDYWKFEVEDWQLSSRSLLNRDANGNYKFAHRSIMEYLFIRSFLSGDAVCYGVSITDQMKVFLQEILHMQFAPCVIKARLEITAINKRDKGGRNWLIWDSPDTPTLFSMCANRLELFRRQPPAWVEKLMREYRRENEGQRPVDFTTVFLQYFEASLRKISMTITKYLERRDGRVTSGIIDDAIDDYIDMLSQQSERLFAESFIRPLFSKLDYSNPGTISSLFLGA